MCRTLTNLSLNMKIQILVSKSKKSVINPSICQFPSVMVNERTYGIHLGTNLSMLYTFKIKMTIYSKYNLIFIFFIF